jgi:hypothetical protein
MKKGTLKKILNQCVVCNAVAMLRMMNSGVSLNVNRNTAVNRITLTIRTTPPNYP